MTEKFEGKKVVFTIGHSTHPIEDFIHLLHQYKIDSLIDVRTTPYSQYNPQFNKENLKQSLEQEEILYVHFDKEFGARHTTPSLLNSGGRVDFEKVRAAPEFQTGIKRLEQALGLGYTIVLMCSESNPMDCHRFSMISYQLVKEGIDVLHILKDGTYLTNEQLEKKLLEKFHKKLPQSTLFEKVTNDERLETAYRLIGREVAYRVDSHHYDQESDSG